MTHPYTGGVTPRTRLPIAERRTAHMSGVTLIDPAEEASYFEWHGLTRDGDALAVPTGEPEPTPVSATERREALEFNLIATIMEER